MSKILKRASDDDDNDHDGAPNYIIIHTGNNELASNRRVSLDRRFEKALSALLFSKPMDQCQFAYLESTGAEFCKLDTSWISSLLLIPAL